MKEPSSLTPSENFTLDDIRGLEQISDLAQLKETAFTLVSRPSERPMKPEKIAWFREAINGKKNHAAILKLMWDLYLAGCDQGLSVLGSKNSTKPNSYRKIFA